MYFERRYYLDKLIRSKGNKMIKVITGVRRVGKSYLLNELFYNHLINEDKVMQNQIIKINLDSLSNLKYRNPFDLMEYINSNLLENKVNYVFIDEIQYVEKVENPHLKNDYIGFYEILNELLGKTNVDVYVTGSNSKMLSKDVLTEFRGRGHQIHVMPLSLYEIKQTIDMPFEILYDIYQIYGGLPNIYSIESEEEKEVYLKKLFTESYLIDVIERNHIRNTDELDKLTAIIASSIGSFTNANNIERTFKSELNITYGSQTISKHLSYLKDAFIINEANRYDIKGRKYIGANSKYYYTDIGVRNAKLNFRQIEPTHIMENIIYNQLIMLGYSVDVGIVEINENVDGVFKRKQLEVDFVVNKGNIKYYIQSAYQILSKEKQEQEKKSLININDSFKKIIIINDNFRAHYDDNGFLLISLKEFLLDLDALNKY
ncbi:MAG: ATP-binding protein [Bacilli bacterium]|nr:ATP-binding protein [Bacilli bacterium]